VRRRRRRQRRRRRGRGRGRGRAGGGEVRAGRRGELLRAGPAGAAAREEPGGPGSSAREEAAAGAGDARTSAGPRTKRLPASSTKPTPVATSSPAATPPVVAAGPGGAAAAAAAKGASGESGDGGSRGPPPAAIVAEAAAASAPVARGELQEYRGAGGASGVGGGSGWHGRKGVGVLLRRSASAWTPRVAAAVRSIGPSASFMSTSRLRDRADRACQRSPCAGRAAARPRPASCSGAAPRSRAPRPPAG
jgi:hypothetical protein